jgi:hypothetical protein
VFVFNLVARPDVVSDQQGKTNVGGAAAAQVPKGVESIWQVAFGNIAFNDNIVSLIAQKLVRRGAVNLGLAQFAPPKTAGFNVALISYDDVGSDSNRIACVNRMPMIANLFAAASTVRATANRLQEPDAAKTILSALTVGDIANATALNQADHCIADVILNSAFDITGRPHILPNGLPQTPVLQLNAQHVALANGEEACREARGAGKTRYGEFAWLIWVIEVVGVIYAQYQASHQSTVQTIAYLKQGFEKTDTTVTP